MINYEKLIMNKYRDKYKNSIKRLNRRLETLNKHLAINLEKMISIRPDERTQRKVAIHAKRDELTTEKRRLTEIKEEMLK